jgi:long-chain acyl-CoA synthetase
MALNARPAGIPALVLQHSAIHGTETILRKKDRGIWHAVSWATLAARMRAVGAALQEGGFGAGDVGAVLAETTPDWVFADLGILAAGGVSAGIPPEIAVDELGPVLRTMACRVLFVENEEQLDKALEVRGSCPALRRIVIFDMKGLREFADPTCESFAALLARGAGAEQWSVAAVSGDDPAVLLLNDGTSRTLTHAVVMAAVADAAARLAPRSGDERVAVLPMAARLERIGGLYLALYSLTISNYLENPDTGLENMQEVQPTVLGADAALWQRLYERASRAAAAATPVQRLLYRCAVRVAQRGGLAAALARRLVLQPVRRELGLGRLRLAIADAALPPGELAAWTRALGIVIRAMDSPPVSPAAAAAAHGVMPVEA